MAEKNEIQESMRILDNWWFSFFFFCQKEEILFIIRISYYINDKMHKISVWNKATFLPINEPAH